MGSSHGFGSHRRYTVRLFETRLPSGSPALALVNLQRAMHSPDHSTKGTPSALGAATAQWPLTACEYVVSGTLSSPSRGTFHLSLTVLVRYRSLKFFSLGGWSPQLPTRLHVSRGTQDTSHSRSLVLYGTLTPSGGTFQCLRVRKRLLIEVLQPRLFTRNRWFGLFPVRSPLLRESRLISLTQATEMFQFTHDPPYRLCVQR